MKNRLSLDSIENDFPAAKAKDDKKKKEKKGMLGGMFRRKDKKSKGQEKDNDESEKASSDLTRKSPTPKESMESLSQDAKASPQPHRQTSKLQKQPPAKLSPKTSYNAQSQAQNQVHNQQQRSGPAEPQTAVASGHDRAFGSSPEQNGSMRLVLPEPRPLFDDAQPPLQHNNPEPAREAPITSELPREKDSPKEKTGTVFSPFVNALKPAPSEAKPEMAKKAKERMLMDDFDSSSASSIDQPTDLSSMRESNDEPDQRQQSSSKVDLTIAQAAQHDPQPHPSIGSTASTDRLSESPVQVPSPVTAAIGQERSTPHQPPPLMIDTSSPSTASSPSPISPISSPSSLNEPGARFTQAPQDQQRPHDQQNEAPTPLSGSPSTHATTNTNTTTTPPPRSTPTWSDASLRAYMDDDSEIRDLLLVVNDKTGVVGRRDHPVVKDLFKEENERLGEIERQLDGLLGEFLGRRGKAGR